MIDLSNPTVAAYFAQAAMGWTCKQTGKNVHGAILDFYQHYGNAAFCGLTYLGLPLSNEVSLDSSGAVKQFFERGCLVYDVAHKYDNPPGAGQVYLAHIYGGLGEDPLIAQLQKQVSQLEAELAAAKQPAGIDKELVANFQTARAIQAHQIMQAAQALETALVAPIQ